MTSKRQRRATEEQIRRVIERLGSRRYLMLRRMVSASRPGRTHEVRVSTKDRRLYCTCESWQYSAEPEKVCKHVRELDPEYKFQPVGRVYVAWRLLARWLKLR